MALKNDRYTYRVTWSEEDNEHVGLCAEFPSLSWLAWTPEAALQGIRKVVADVVAALEANGAALRITWKTQSFSFHMLCYAEWYNSLSTAQFANAVMPKV